MPAIISVRLKLCLQRLQFIKQQLCVLCIVTESQHGITMFLDMYAHGLGVCVQSIFRAIKSVVYYCRYIYSDVITRIFYVR